MAARRKPLIDTQLSVGESIPMDGAQVRIWPDNVMDCLAAMEIELQAAGFPPMSPWWWDTLRSFYASGKRQLVARVGRRGGKSSTVSRVAVAEVLTRRHRVQPGDTGVVAVVSVDRREAADRVATMHAILRALNIAHKPKADGIELPDRPYAIAIRTGSISGVSGFTCICALGDEVSKWKDTDTGVNPAEQVLSSWRPTMATMPGAKMFLLSSPMGSDDAHARAFDAGNNAMQMVAYAPTWVAHPALTQGMLEAMESNRRIFRREYEAVPSPEVEGSLLTSQELERATEPHAMRLPEGKHDYIAALDTATRSQVWSLAIVTSRWDSGRERVTVVLSRSWCGTHDERPDPSSVLREVSAICAAYGIHGVRVDKGTCPEAHQRTAMEAGIALVFENLSRLQWLRGYDYLAALCAEDRLGIPDVEELRSDLLTVKKKVTATGADIELAKGADQMHAYHSLPLVLATYRGVASPDPEERERTPGELLQDEERRHWKPVLEKLAEYRDDWYDV